MNKTIILMLLITIASYVNGQTTVTLDLPNPCSATEIKNIVKNDFNLTISPNPTDGKFSVNISSNEIIGKVKIQITDIRGSVIFNEEIFSGNLKCIKTYNLNNLSKGIYNISISNIKFTETKIIIIQ